METVHGHNSQFSSTAPNTGVIRRNVRCRGGAGAWQRQNVSLVTASAACVSLHCTAAPIADIMQHSDISYFYISITYFSIANNFSRTFLTIPNSVKIHILTSFEYILKIQLCQSMTRSIAPLCYATRRSPDSLMIRYHTHFISTAFHSFEM